MATLRAIGFTVAWGSAVSVACFAGFAAAVHFGFNSEIAPRTASRPKRVIWNVLKRPYGLRWIPWALSLSYKQMLEGIPGTGTRKSGWSGSLLKCNLDGVIVCKFNALCLRISVFATVLCLMITLPLNMTAECNPLVVGEDICQNISDLSSFDKTTLANIPPYDTVDDTATNTTASPVTFSEDEVWTGEYISNTVLVYFSSAPGITSRLFGIVLVAWCVYIYSCMLLWQEWIDNLSLRRAYYLEQDHYEDRKDELDYLMSLQDPEDPLQEDRPPHLPHPELRETVPSVCLYSVLYKLPDRFANRNNTPENLMLDKQLCACVDFFDKCVPNQPGFSSSVAAVTILPNAAQVTTAWKKWFHCAAKLRRLRFIRRRIELLAEKEESFEDKGLEDFDPFLHRASKITGSEMTSLSPKNGFDSSNRSKDRASEDVTVANGESSGPLSLEHFMPGSRTDPDSKEDDFTPGRDQTAATLEPIDENNSESSAIDLSENRLEVAEDNNHTLHDENQEETVSEEICFDSCNEYLEPKRSESPLDVTEANNHSMHDENHDEIVSEEICFDGCNDYLEPGAAEDPSILPSSPGHRKVVSDSAILVPTDGSETLGVPQRLHSDTPNHPMNMKQRRHFVKFDKRRSSLSTSDGGEGGRGREEFLSDDGMEQLSVYCREFAQSSGGLCPYGCDEIFIRYASLERLEELEDEAEEEAREANKELIEARLLVNHQASDGNVVQNVRDRRSRQLSLLNDLVESSSDESSSSSSSSDEETGRAFTHIQTRFVGDNDLRQRTSSTAKDKWRQANRNLQGAKGPSKRRNAVKLRKMPSGRWHLPSLTRSFYKSARTRKNKITKAATSAVKQSTYAVITFTSRQAAIAARQCLADGAGWDRWTEVEDIPVPPLADGPAWNLLFGRGICKPVTITLNDNAKKCRHKTTIFWLTVFCLLYSIPISFASSLLSPGINNLFPELGDLVGDLAGIISGLLYSLFFSICPLIFKAFANYGSGATSIRQAEYSALKYYWVFILVTAYAGNYFVTMIRQGLYTGGSLGAEAQEVLRQVANTLPTQISATWLNWILVRVFSTLPMSYLLQVNTFFFRGLGMRCCARLMQGGGPGGPMPYRVYVDSGTVFLCIVALAPVCPLVAPAAMLYFLVFSPLIRWLLIFVYRPEYDGGGLRWPLIHEMFISSLIVSQILMTSMMVLKKAYGPAFLAGAAIFPTYMFSEVTKDRFLRSYMDAGLLQTSELDGWDTSKPTSKSKRDEYRRWLVDSHKAAFVPICLAGLDNFLTMEPAVVIPTERDTGNAIQEEKLTPSGRFSVGLATEDMDEVKRIVVASPTEESTTTTISTQRGALFRRTVAANAV